MWFNARILLQSTVQGEVAQANGEGAASSWADQLKFIDADDHTKQVFNVYQIGQHANN